MQLYLRLAWRNIWRHKRRTLIIVLAIGLTLAMMMMYDGLIDGFDQAVYGNAIRVLGGNIQVHAPGYRANVDSSPLLPLDDAGAVVRTASAHPEVVAASPRIQTGGMASNHEGAFPVSIIGIEPEAEIPVSMVAERIAEGRFLESADRDVILIGRGLANAMDIRLGERLTLVGSDIHKQNRQRSLIVIGIYDLGLPSTEKKTVYISLGEAQDLYGLSGRATEVVINLRNLGEEPKVVAALAPALPGYEVESWERNYPEMQTAITTKTSVMNVFGVIILFIAGIGILNVLLMAVYERTREIGLLGAMGVKPWQITGLFLLEGALIGVVGAVAGVILGVASNASLAQVGLDYTQFAGVTEYMALISGRVYPTLGLSKVPFRAITAVVIAILAAWIPAREASRREPAEALHYV